MVAKATILRNMEPSIDPVGWFDEGYVGHTKFIPIKKNKKYRVICTQQAFAVVNGKLTAVGRAFNIVYNKIT